MTTDYPYLIGQTSADYFMTPIRDVTYCASIHPPETHIVPILGATAYVDLWVVEVQFVILALLLLIIPALSYRHKKYGLITRLISYVIGLAYAELILLASIRHAGGDVVIAFLVGVTFLLATPPFVYSVVRHRNERKNSHKPHRRNVSKA